MSKLSVVTKNNDTPRGKARIYFSCHPGDFDKYFKVICSDIFATQDCAVFYESDWKHEADESELKDQLQDMQLFVVPVSGIYLTEENRSKSIEFPFALEQHIPVLPIAMEQDLAELYAQKMNDINPGMGDTQLLDRTSADRTEIPYKEKLEKRLSAVIAGNKLAARVRAAFDAYIFLSYRKKDREAARELMRTIHRIPFCRDIAIWYDEYLIPGEQWNKSIAEALQKSSLMTMLVTPSIVEPGNYIAEHEYPDAVAANKTVLPVEMVPTDRGALAGMFKGLSIPTDGTDVETLANKFKEIAVKRNPSTPEHDYLVGLAYLEAIDVERNPERACELITSAAEQGYTEAMKKLADMYFAGAGVRRDVNASMEWMEKYCEALEKKDFADIEYMDGLEKCGDMWMSLGRADRSLVWYEKLLIEYEIFVQGSKLSNPRQLLAHCHNKIGNALLGIGRVEEARIHHEKALEIEESVVKKDRDIKLKYGLSNSYTYMGYVCEQEGNSKEALTYYEKALEVSLKVERKEKTATARRDLAIAYSDVARACKALGRLEEACDYYTQSLAIMPETDEQTIKENTCDVLMELGEIWETEGQTDAAKDCYERALSMAEAVSGGNLPIYERHQLAVIHSRLGDLCKITGDIKAEIYHRERAVKLIRAVAKNTGRIWAKNDLIVGRFNLANVYWRIGKYMDSRLQCEKVLELADEIGQEDLAIKQAVAGIRHTLGLISEKEGKLLEAKLHYKAAVDLFEEVTEDEEDAEIIGQFGVALLDLANLCVSEKDYSVTEDYYRRAYDILKKLYETTGKQLYKEALTVTSEKIAIVSKLKSLSQNH